MATAAAADDGLSPKLQIVLVVDKKRNRVMFAEAKKDFVDFIFHILSLPLGTVQTFLLEASLSFGSVGTLYDGLKKLDDEYKEVPAKDYLSDLKAINRGYVKELVTYMVMDDLVVRPAEPSSVISLMKLLSIKDVGDIERRVVTFGTTWDFVNLLKALVSSKQTVLTDTFLSDTVVKAEN